MTRAKKILVLVGEKKAVFYAIKNETTTGRNTGLRQRLAMGKKQLIEEMCGETCDGKETVDRGNVWGKSLKYII